MSKAWKKELVSTERAPAPLSRSSAQAVRAGPLLFVTGQGGRKPGTSTYLPTAKEQARQCLENIKGIVEAAGSSMDQILKRTVFVPDRAVLSEIRDIIDEYFTAPCASTTVGALLMGESMLIEVEVIALIPEQGE